MTRRQGPNPGNVSPLSPNDREAHPNDRPTTPSDLSSPDVSARRTQRPKRQRRRKGINRDASPPRERRRVPGDTRNQGRDPRRRRQHNSTDGGRGSPAVTEDEATVESSPHKPRKPRQSKFQEEFDDAPMQIDRAAQMESRLKGRTEYHSRYKTFWTKIWTINGFLPWIWNGVMWAFSARWIRFLGRESPWILMLAEIVMLLYIGTSGMDALESLVGYRWFAILDGVRMSGWAFCSQTECIRMPLLHPNAQASVWYLNPVILAGLIVGLGLLGLLLSLCGLYILFLRYAAHRGETALSCLNCCQSCLEKGEADPEAQGIHGKPKKPKKGWQTLLDWTMWTAAIWILMTFIGTEMWMRGTDAVGMQGDSLMPILLGMAASWVLVSQVYQSKWAGGRSVSE